MTDVDIRALRGPLDDEQVQWITELYGPVDAKYRSVSYVRHQFVGNPFGWSVNVFAVAGERAVGHCGVIPFHARRGEKPFVAGKLEALAVEAAFRGRRAADGGSVAADILSHLYPFAVEDRIEVLFGLAPPAVARIHERAGCHLVATNAPAYTCVTNPSSFGSPLKKQLAVHALGAAQLTVLLSPRSSPPTEPPSLDDKALSAVDTADGSWTVVGADAWDWFVGSGVLCVLDLPDSRALIRLDRSQPAMVQILAWRPRGRRLAAAFRLLRATVALARERGAPTLRFQPWRGDEDERVLARACALAGFVRRAEADLLLYPSGAGVDDFRLTPFFFVTF
jgi:hypothetical protein